MASLTQAGITFGDGTSQTTAAFPSGTVMLFAQSAAPTGWTKSIAHNDKALRVVSGSASSGGSVAFSTAFAAGLNAGATTLSIAQMPSHTHSISFASNANVSSWGNDNRPWVGGNTGATGGGGSHTHTMPSFAVQYVDVIIGSKD